MKPCQRTGKRRRSGQRGRNRSLSACWTPGWDGMWGANRSYLKGAGPRWALPPPGAGPTPRRPARRRLRFLFSFFEMGAAAHWDHKSTLSLGWAVSAPQKIEGAHKAQLDLTNEAFWGLSHGLLFYSLGSNLNATRFDLCERCWSPQGG
jgi:hypothetical protein